MCLRDYKRLPAYAKKYKNGEMDKHKCEDQNNKYFYKLISSWDKR